MSDIVILGAGMAGYGAAHYLTQAGLRPTIFEKNTYFGGHTHSYEYDQGFVFDEGPHISFTKDERMQGILAEFVDEQYENLQAKANNYFEGHWVKHPAQCNLYGLPPELITQIITEFALLGDIDMSEIKNYEQWLIASFGETFATRFPMRYGLRYHTTEAKNMSTDWLGPRLYKPNLQEVIKGALSPETEDVHYISNFRYPTAGGFKTYLNRMGDFANIELSHKAIAIDPITRQIDFANGKVKIFKKLVSSLPLTELLPIIKNVPDDVMHAVQKLSCTKCVVVNLGIERPDVADADWTYIYDEDICFTRLSYPYRFSPNNAPKNTSSIQAELYFSDKYKPLTQPIDSYIPRVIADLKRIGLLAEDDKISLSDAKLLPYANIIFDLDREAAVKIVRDYLEDIDIQVCGRYGEWAYIWTDESFVSGESAAEFAINAL